MAKKYVFYLIERKSTPLAVIAESEDEARMAVTDFVATDKGRSEIEDELGMIQSDWELYSYVEEYSENFLTPWVDIKVNFEEE